MLALIKQIDDEKLSVMSTDDYLLLASIFREEDLRGIPLERFEHLIELEIVKLSDQGIEPANGGIILTIGGQSAVSRRSIDNQSTANRLPIDCQSIATVDKQSINTSDRKKQILTLIGEHNKVTSAQLAEFTGLTPGRVRTILQELTADELIIKIGNYRHTHYEMKNKTQ